MDTLKQYASNCSQPVVRQTSQEMYGTSRIIERELAWKVEGGKLRHEPAHLAMALSELLQADSHRHISGLPHAS